MFYLLKFDRHFIFSIISISNCVNLSRAVNCSSEHKVKNNLFSVVFIPSKLTKIDLSNYEYPVTLMYITIGSTF